jgi:hypothetical protein
VTVPAGGCVTVPITIGCPSNIPLGQVACYQVSLFNHDTGRLFACKGSVRAPNKWCVRWNTDIGTPVVGVLPLAEGAAVPLRVSISNLSRSSAAKLPLAYELRAYGDHHEDAPSRALLLNGLPPGEPVIGTLSIAPGGSADVDFLVKYPRAWRIGYERIALWGDDDGDGIPEILGEMAVSGVPTGSAVSVSPRPGAVSGSAELGRLFTGVPNPFGTTGAIRFRLPGSEPAEVKLRLFDVFSRMVRVFHMERLLPPGEHTVPWIAMDDRGIKLGSGMYFLRLEIGKRSETVKVVVRQ